MHGRTSSNSIWILLLAASHLFSLLSASRHTDLIFARPTSYEAIASTCALFFAALTILAPQLRGAVTGMLLSYLTMTWLSMPSVPNHQVLLSLIDLLLLLDLARRSEHFPSSHTVATTRALIVVIYFFAALAKMNSEFLGPLSCADIFTQHIGAFFRVLSGKSPLDSVPSNVIRWGALVIEFLLLPLLIFRRTRSVGVLLAMLFHLGLAIDPVKRFFNFSAVMYVGLLTFLLPLRDALRLPRLLVASAKAGSLLFLFAALCLSYDAELSTASLLGRFALGAMLWLLSFVPISLFLLSRNWRAPPESSLSGASAPYLAVLLVALLNGLAPYLGLKTGSSFTMYSNLRIDAQSSNHLIIPRSLNLLGLMEEPVTIVGSSNEALRAAIQSEGSLRVYPFELYRLLLEHPNDYVEYENQLGEQRRAGRGSPLPPAPPFLWLRWWIVFHPLHERAPRCIW